MKGQETKTMKKETKLESYIYNLTEQNKRLELLIEDIRGNYISRLDSLCNKINSISFPKNSKELENSTLKYDGEEEEVVDGITEDFKNIIETNRRLQNKLNFSVFSELETSISYLEAYI